MKKILINEEAWQTRIAIIDKDGLQNIYFWSHTDNNIERCFYKGLVSKVLPGIQTAFVEIGQEKAGFLHISEIDRELAGHKMHDDDDFEATEKETTRKKHHQPMDISKIFKENESILVQVSKEPINEKGAKLTTCFALPGRFIVLMPSIARIAISKKIESREERARLRELVSSQLPEGMGAIIRTSTEGCDERHMRQDIAFLIETWNSIQKAFVTAEVGQKIYEDLALPFQVVRDHLDDDISEVIIDSEETQRKISRFVRHIAPEHSAKVKLYTGKTPLFEKYDLEKEIKNSLRSKAHLKSGGSIVIEATEAMTVVDVNTGRFIGKTNMEETIFKTNMEAAVEVTRQLKVRNIGGLIVIDFIDMANSSNRQKLFKFFEKTLKEQDKFQSVLLKISEFGLVQMTRKRSGITLAKQLTDTCVSCCGTGATPSVQAETFALLRHLKDELKNNKGSVTIKLSPEVFDYIAEHEYATLLELEKNIGGKIILEKEKTLSIGTFKIEKK
jgi:ribonuclease G